MTEHNVTKMSENHIILRNKAGMYANLDKPEEGWKPFYHKKYIPKGAKSVELQYGDATDLTPLTELRDLRTLIFYFNIYNLNMYLNYTKLTQLKEVYLKCSVSMNNLDLLSSFNKMENIEIFEISLTALGKDRIHDINQITMLTKLTGLDIMYSRKNMENLTRLINLTDLNLGICKLKDISFLEKMTKLKSLDLYCNPIGTTTSLENLTNLEKLDISNTEISGLGNLTRLTKLSQLKCWSNNFVRLDYLSHPTFINLRSIMLSVNLDNWKNVLYLTNLRSLNLSGRIPSDIDFEDSFPYLERICLKKLELTNVSGLKDSKNLKGIYLSQNNFNSLDFLEQFRNCTQLERIDMCWNSKLSEFKIPFFTTALQMLNLPDGRLDDYRGNFTCIEDTIKEDIPCLKIKDYYFSRVTGEERELLNWTSQFNYLATWNYQKYKFIEFCIGILSANFPVLVMIAIFDQLNYPNYIYEKWRIAEMIKNLSQNFYLEIDD